MDYLGKKNKIDQLINDPRYGCSTKGVKMGTGKDHERCNLNFPKLGA